jgi:hypothetical protein
MCVSHIIVLMDAPRQIIQGYATKYRPQRGLAREVHPAGELTRDLYAPVNSKPRPHTLGLDDAPFDKRQGSPVPIVAVAMEGHDLIESIALGEFSVDGDGPTEYLAAWIGGLRARPMLLAVILGGITIAGLGLIDVTASRSDSA